MKRNENEEEKVLYTILDCLINKVIVCTEQQFIEFLFFLCVFRFVFNRIINIIMIAFFFSWLRWK